MKRLLVLLCVAASLCACRNAKPEAESAAALQDQQEALSDGSEYEKNGRYCIFRDPLSIDSDDGAFHVSITMSPDFSQPAVNDEGFGRVYCDNKANLCITMSGDTIAHEQFTKTTFLDYIDQATASHAIFNRLTCRGFTKDEVKLEAEISVPHSEEQCYVTIVVNRSGAVSMKRYEAEEVPDEIIGG